MKRTAKTTMITHVRGVELKGYYRLRGVRVQSCSSGIWRTITGGITEHGYASVSFVTAAGGKITERLHRLVALAAHGPLGNLVVHHRRHDDRPESLLPISRADHARLHARIDPDRVRRLSDGGMTWAEIGDALKCSRRTVAYCLSRTRPKSA